MDCEKKGKEGVDWVNVAKYRARWRAVVNTLMNIKVNKMGGVC